MSRLRPIATGGTACGRHQYGAPLRPWRYERVARQRGAWFEALHWVAHWGNTRLARAGEAQDTLADCSDKLTATSGVGWSFKQPSGTLLRWGRRWPRLWCRLRQKGADSGRGGSGRCGVHWQWGGRSGGNGWQWGGSRGRGGAFCGRRRQRGGCGGSGGSC
eukprot:6213995-Pleurochrysis_carterae.AAC.1